MKLLTKLLLALMLVGIFTYIVPARAEMMVRMEGLGEGKHPGVMFHSPMSIGTLQPAIGWMTTDDICYELTWDITMAKAEDGDGYFVRLGSDFESWNPTIAIGGILAASDWLEFNFFYKWGYTKNPEALEYIQGFDGAPGIAIIGSF